MEKVLERIQHSRALAEHFNFACILLGKTQDEIAGLCNVSPKDLNKIKNGSSHLVERTTLLKVFEFLPFEGTEDLQTLQTHIKGATVFPNGKNRPVICYSQR